MNDHDDLDHSNPESLDFKISDNKDELGYGFEGLTPELYPDSNQIPQNQAIAKQTITGASLSNRTFTIMGLGSVERTRDMQRKWFSWSPFEPTGIFCRANEQIQIRVHGNHGIGAFIGTARLANGNFTPQLRNLNPGLNTISNATAGLLYFTLRHNHTITVEVVSGGIFSPLFVLGKHTQSDWQQMLNNLSESGLVELISKRTWIVATRQNALNHLQGDPSHLLRTIDRTVEYGDEVSGLADFMPLERDRPDPHRLGFIADLSNQSFMFATHYATGYNSQTAIMYVLDVNRYVNNGWGPWHEQGHMRQMLSWMWSLNLLQEVTVNIYTLYIERELGNQSRLERTGTYNPIFAFLNQPTRNFDAQGDAFIKLAMFWQLDLAFGKNFYPKLHQAYRALPTVPSHNSGDANRQLFIQMASQNANRNLRPFFERWGVSVTAATNNMLNQLPPLMNQIWNSRDMAPVVEYIIPGIEAPVLVANQITANSVSLSWNQPDSIWSHKNYEIFKNNIRIGTTTGIHFSDSNLTASTTYSYTVRAINKKDQTSAHSNMISIQNGKQTTPVEPSPELPSGNEQRLQIVTALNGTSMIEPSGANLILWSRRNQGSQVWTFSFDQTTNTYTIRNVSDGRFLTEVNNHLTLSHQMANHSRWRILPVGGNLVEIQNFATNRLVDVSGGNTSANGTSVITWTRNNNPNQRWILQSADETTPPKEPDVPTLQAPTHLREGGRTSNSITLDWNSPSQMTNVQGFRVFRNNAEVGTTQNTVTRFVDAGLMPNTSFSYRVASFNGATEASSNTISVSTLQVTSPPPGTGGIFFRVEGEGTTRQHVTVTNRTGANISNLWRVNLTYTGGNPTFEWPATWAQGSSGNASTTVNGILTNNGSIRFPIGVSANTRISSLTVNGQVATRE